MPKVPTYDTPQVAPAAAPGPYSQGVNPKILAEGRAGAYQMSDAGQALEGAGQVLTKEQADAQAMANQVRVDAGLNDTRAYTQALTYGAENDPSSGYLNRKGAAALDPDDQGRPLPEQYAQKLRDKIGEISASLGNDAQRQVFQQQAAGILTQFTGNVQAHMLQEYRQFGLQTQEGTIKLAADAAKSSWDNPDQIAPQIQSAQAAVWKAGKISGEPANLTQAKIQQVTSAIHSGVIDAALQNNNPSYALAYINAKKGEMTADDLLKANGLVDQDMRARVATSTAQNAMTALQSKLAPTDADRMVQITAQAESGNQDTNPDGSAVTSPKGAKGRMQVLDGTNTDPGFGVTPAKDDSPEERARVGRDYLAAMVKRYGGDPAKAWAAYNAGPKTVDDALKSGDNWLAQIPKETQDYVQKNVAALQKGATAPLPSLQDVHDNIRQQLGPNADPRVLKAALDEGARQYQDFIKDRKTQGDNAVVAAQQWLIQNNGNMAALPPDMRQSVTQYAPDKYDNLVDFSKKVAKGENVTNMSAYLDAVAHPEELAKMSDATFNHFAITNFSQTDAKRIADLRQDQLTGKDDQSAGGLNRSALNTALNNRLTSIGINPSPKDLGEKARVGSIQKFITDGVFAQQQQLGRKMTAQEVGDYVDATMAKNVSFRNTFLGIDTGGTQQNLLSMKVSDIPSDSVKQIRVAFAQAGNTRPTDDQILRTYWTSKNKNGR